MKRLSGDQKNGGAPEAFKDPEGRGGETPVRPLAQKGKAGPPPPRGPRFSKSRLACERLMWEYSTA
jgi:hypothetical protein